MRVLVACEFSGVVRDAFTRRGHEAWSCDLLPSDREGNHVQGDVLKLFDPNFCEEHFGWRYWDLMIAHPPCTHLACSGAKYFAQKRADGRMGEGIDFFMKMITAPVSKIAVENPVGVMSTVWRKPDHIIQPYQFGHPESKATCLWLKGLPKLMPTNVLTPQWRKNPDGTDAIDVKGKRVCQARNTPQVRWQNQTPSGQNKLAPSADRWKLRSITYQGIAEAMAEQWSK